MKIFSYFVVGVIFVTFTGARQISVAADITIVTPLAIIYPRDVILKGMIQETTVNLPRSSAQAIARRDVDVISKVARRTLLPGKPIYLSSIAEPVLFKLGAPVRIRFNVNGILIVATGIAMQAGSVGSTIRVRNSDSGIIVIGVITRDGFVNVTRP